MVLLQGQVLNNRYRIVSLLGQGGFGAVYRAWDINMECPRALKENLDTSPESQRQFKQEAKLLGELVHPNLPRVIDHFIIPGQGQYLVMDLVEGEDLQQMMNKSGTALNQKQVMAWIDQICDALVYMHSRQPPVIHRDIKPANIKITSDDKAVLVDFGIAKIYFPGVSTTTGARAVTHGYSPPEQYGAGITDPQSDLYSLAATTYALLCGQAPPPAMSISAGLATTPPQVSELNPAVSLKLSQAIASAMQMHRDDRTKSVIEFKSALAMKANFQIPAFQSSPVVLPGSIVQPKNKNRKRYIIVGGLTFIIVCLVIFLFLSWVNAGGEARWCQFLGFLFGPACP